MRTGGAFDVAIIGAGPAGASLAIALSRAGYDTVLLHRPDRGATASGVAHETLAGAARAALQALGIWDAFRQINPLQSTGTMAWWGEDGGAELPAFFTSYGSGWHVARPAFDEFLRAQARQAGAELRLFDGLVGATRTSHAGWRLRLRAAADISAAFIVDATGRSRVLARRLGARSERDDDLIALIGLVQTAERRHSGKLLIEAVKCGWCYAVPATERDCTIALVTNPATVTALGLGNPKRWRAELSRASLLGRKMDLSTAPADVLRRLAGASRAVPSGGANWLAVGDAAMSFDPLAGKGLRQGIRDGLRGAEAISHWLNGSREPLQWHLRMQAEGYDHHLRQKQSYYQLIERWKDIPFWQARSERRMAGHEATFS